MLVDDFDSNETLYIASQQQFVTGESVRVLLVLFLFVLMRDRYAEHTTVLDYEFDVESHNIWF